MFYVLIWSIGLMINLLLMVFGGGLLFGVLFNSFLMVDIGVFLGFIVGAVVNQKLIKKFF